MSKTCNYIYEKLVKDDSDLVGLIAYAIYKKHKIEFIEAIRNNEQRDPTEDEYQAFAISSNVDSQLLKYRTDAEQLLSEMVLTAAGDEIEAYEKEMLKDYQNTIKNSLPPAWQNILYSVIGSFVFSIILGLFFFLGATSEKEMKDSVDKTIEQVIEHQVDSINIKQVSDIYENQ